MQVYFHPHADGTRSGNLRFQDNSPNSPQIVTLTGTGIGTGAFVTTAPIPVFHNQLVGTTSPPVAVVLKNIGNGLLTIFGFQVSGDFAQTNNCPANVPAGSSCTINVTFTPTATGLRTGLITVIDNSPGSYNTIHPRGNGY